MPDILFLSEIGLYYMSDYSDSMYQKDYFKGLSIVQQNYFDYSTVINLN